MNTVVYAQKSGGDTLFACFIRVVLSHQILFVALVQTRRNARERSRFREPECV
jgi:hypothetical protein